MNNILNLDRKEHMGSIREALSFCCLDDRPVEKRIDDAIDALHAGFAGGRVMEGVFAIMARRKLEDELLTVKETNEALLASLKAMIGAYGGSENMTAEDCVEAYEKAQALVARLEG